MARNLLPSRWETARLKVEDSTLAEARELQEINDAVPQTRDWMRVEGQGQGDWTMLRALQEGVLPPVPNRSRERFRLQSIRRGNSKELMGFLAVYHGFPDDGTLWINTLTLHLRFQGQGYGPELLRGLSEIVARFGYARMRTYVPLTNWPSLRLCVKVGLNRMVEIAGDQVHTDQAEAHVLLEKALVEPPMRTP